MEENSKERQPESKSGEQRSTSNRRRNRRRPRRKKSAAGAQQNQSQDQSPKQDQAQKQGQGQQPSENRNNRRRKSSSNQNRQNRRGGSRRDNSRRNGSGNGSGNESRESGKRSNRNRRRRPRKRGRNQGGRVGTLVDATGKLIRKKEPMAEPINVGAELNSCREKHREEIESIKKSEFICVICNEKIDDPLTAVLYKDGKGHCHFDCVQNTILKTEKLEENEKLVYIGSGDYAVFQFRKNRGKTYHFLRKRIEYKETGSERRGQG